ncbi:hypothetical protein NPIL_238521 [Nephila pilipes]|uniref:Uncharacterized protein n=1 Tax=Nephila pilipes TaxID=299642 RepID=A0A8X6NXM5_NEPPI|nr:hypothetical protein NPIL_238521 [Nephila pilipes]
MLHRIDEDKGFLKQKADRPNSKDSPYQGITWLRIRCCEKQEEKIGFNSCQEETSFLGNIILCGDSTSERSDVFHGKI